MSKRAAPDQSEQPAAKKAKDLKHVHDAIAVLQTTADQLAKEIEEEKEKGKKKLVAPIELHVGMTIEGEYAQVGDEHSKPDDAAAKWMGHTQLVTGSSSWGWSRATENGGLYLFENDECDCLYAWRNVKIVPPVFDQVVPVSDDIREI